MCAFLDNDKAKKNTIVDGIKVYSFSQFMIDFSEEQDVVAIIDNYTLANIFFSELYEMGFDQNRIFRTNDDIIRTQFGEIYFDLLQIESNGNEIFVDAGSFDGSTIRQFLEWRKV